MRLGPNVSQKFKDIVSSVGSSVVNILKNSVNYTSSSGFGVSHAVDVKQRMSQIEWSRGYSWDVYLSPEPPAPFNSTSYGIPVVEVQSDFALIGKSKSLQFANSTYNIPDGKSFFDIKLTVLDDEKGTMEEYFEEWQNQIYSWDNDGKLNGTINYLSASVRQLDITKLNAQKREVFKRSYLVYPEANLSTFNNSTGGVRNFTINLVVAGYLGKSKTGNIVKETVQGNKVSYNGNVIWES